MIKVTFLGTSGSAPTKSRNLPGVAITREGESLLFDCGEGTQRQLIKFGVNLSKINYVFITHIHGDHIIGIAGLIRTFALNRRTKPLQIFVPKGGEKAIETLVKFDRVLINYPIIIKGIRGGVILKNKEYIVRAFRLRHTVPTYGYALIERDKTRFIKEKCIGYGIKGKMFSSLLNKKVIKVNGKYIHVKDVTYKVKGIKVVYVADTRPMKSTAIIAKDADLLMHEATFSESLKKLAIARKHSTASEAAMIAKIAKAKMLVLFHFSARYKSTYTLIREAKKIFENTFVAKDGMVIILGNKKKGS